MNLMVEMASKYGYFNMGQRMDRMHQAQYQFQTKLMIT